MRQRLTHSKDSVVSMFAASCYRILNNIWFLKIAVLPKFRNLTNN